MTNYEIILIIVASVAVIGFGAAIFLWNKKEHFELNKTDFDPDKDTDRWNWDEPPEEES
jgi:hypothetical protein